MPSKPAARKRELDPYTLSFLRREFVKQAKTMKRMHALALKVSEGGPEYWCGWQKSAAFYAAYIAALESRTKPKRVAAGKGAR